MKLAIVILIVFTTAAFVTGQKSVSDLDPLHATALEKYLSANKTRKFRPETVLSAAYLKTTRAEAGFGAKFKPSYATGDFNGDRLPDFAVLLKRDGEPEWPMDETRKRVDEHSPDYPLTLVIFNGTKTTEFKVAFTLDLMGPAATFLNTSMVKGKRVLNMGIFETGNAWTFKPAGTGYKVEEEEW